MNWEVKNKKLIFECGCQFDVIEENPDPTILPRIKKFDNNNLPDCKRVWELIGQGKVKGVFQLESNLGKTWAMRVAPENLEHLSALGAILRPSVLECVSGDTKIKSWIKNTDRNRLDAISYTIRDVYNRYKNDHSSFKGRVVSFNEETGEIFNNNIVKMYSNGNKEVFRPIFKTRNRTCLESKFYSLECTDSHKLLTYGRGWIDLKDIQKGERVAVLRHNLEHVKRYGNKLIYGEKTFRDICYYNYMYKCIFCDWKEGSLDVNHVNGNRKTDNSCENLSFLCPNHHRMYSEGTISKELLLKEREKYKIKQYKNIIWVEYSHKESSGIKDVYDIEVAGNFHNYLAGNVVVHNCRDEDGVSMTDHYARRKNKQEIVESIHPVIDNILKNTYSIIVFQEQAIRLAVELAGFTPSEADSLRKAIGKKDTAEMAKVEVKFIDGIKKTGVVTEELGRVIFDNIKKSQRYSFNASHSHSYSVIGYQTGYSKTHFPLQFFRSYLAWAKEKMDKDQEMSDLIMEAKLFNIETYPPKFQDFELDTYDDGKKIYLGLTEIRGVGVKVVKKIEESLKENPLDLNSLSMDELIVYSQLFIGESVFDKMIWAGAFSKWSSERKRNSDKLSKFYQLSKGEQAWCLEYVRSNPGKSLIQVFEACGAKKKDGGGCHSDNRVQFVKDLVETIKNPPSSLDDTQFSIYNAEQNAFGVSLTVSKVDTVDVIDVSQTCKDFIDTKQKQYILAVEIIDFRTVKVKRGKSAGKEMAFLSVTDGTAKLDNVTLFAESYEKNKDLLEKGKVVVIRGYKDNKNGSVSFIVEDIYKGEK